MISLIKKLIYKINNVFVNQILFRKEYAKVKKLQERKLKELQRKDKIKVAFFALFESVWKYDDVYRLLSENPRYELMVFVCPIVNQGEEYMINQSEKSYQYFIDKGFKVINTYDKKNNSFLDIRRVFDPDVIFYTNPYRSLIDKRYFIDKFPDKLTCYVPYAIMATKDYGFYDLNFHNLLWKNFSETAMHVKIGSKIQRTGGKNYVYTGYPGLDQIFSNKVENNPWRTKSNKIKRIIWAPHHTLHNIFRWSNFLDYHQFFLEVAEKYKNQIHIAFKPHPILKPNLYNEPGWGKEKADAYYAKWENLENGQLEDGKYIDLFLTSDAMILDSGSFITEYLATGKPSLYMVRQDAKHDLWSEYGRAALDHLYQSTQKEEVIRFIEHVILQGKDSMIKKRTKFINEVLKPPYGQSAAKNIVDYLNKQFNTIN